MIRFALYGESPPALAFARAAAAHGSCRLVRTAGLSATSSAELARTPGLRMVADWEELLADPDVDCVIVTAADDGTAAIVRRLLQSGKSVVLPPELAQSTEFFYELALIETETPGRLFPLLERRGHPLVAEIGRMLSEQRLGPVRHVQFERTLAPTAGKSRQPVGLMSTAELTPCLLVDTDLLRALFGPYDQVTASRSGDAAVGFSLATVTLAGQDLPQAVWSAVRGSSAGWKLTLLAEQGSVTLETPADALAGSERTLRLTIQREGEAAAVTHAALDSGDWLLAQYLQPHTPAGPPSIGPPPAVKLWDELSCAVEIVDAVERSIRRRRTIDVYFDPPSERGLFKTQMTAAGCSLLMLTLGAVIFYLVLEASIELPQRIRQILTVLIFVPLGLFLGLQVLYFITRSGVRNR